ncbi:MAG: helix-turn-helix domain-containing protein [Haloarculaceae archaeon]
MSFIAEFEVELPMLRATSQAVPEMRLSGTDIVMDEGRPHKFMFTASGTQFDALESALDEDPTVAEYTAVTTLEDTGHYVVTYAETVETTGAYPGAIEQNIVYLTVDLQDGVYTVRARVSDRDALAAFVEYCAEQSIPLRVERIFTENRETEVGYGLTGDQREALTVAYDRGYFDLPRAASLADVGRELGITAQAASGRIRRGQKRLLEATIV